jgi:ribosomal protein S6
MARKKDVATDDMMMDEQDSSEVRVYELSFHLDPELSETEAEKAYDAIRNAAVAGGSLVAEGAPEKVQLAYTISRSDNAGRRDFDNAYFCWVAYEGDGACHEAALDAVKGEKRVIRFLDIRTTKDAAKHAAEMREMRHKMPEAGEEAVSDTELDAALETAEA